MATKTACCNAPREWLGLGGMRLYRIIDGRKVYPARCSACHMPADEARPTPKEGRDGE